MQNNDNDLVHVSSFVWPSFLARKTKVQRKAMMRRQLSQYPIAVFMLAVVELQRLWRGILLRRRVIRSFVKNNFVRLWRENEALVLNSYRVVPRAAEAKFVNLAKKVQARWRTVLLKNDFDRWSSFEVWPIYYVAAATIQRAWVDYRFLQKEKHHKSRAKTFYATKKDAMAARIQSVWRAHCSKAVFAFYKHLIKFREAGDPALMLRCINPTESDLMDRAAGLHVRFRLAGQYFPPVIVYKVFTHNNVADVCAFAPKNYCGVKARSKPTHNNKPKPGATLTADQKEVAKLKKRQGWYRRFDNNPWRPISESVLSDAEAIAAKYEAQYGMQARTASQQDIIPKDAPFHASRLQRKEDIVRRTKQKRRTWLSQLYAAEQVELMNGHLPSAVVKAESRTLFDKLSDQELEGEVDRLTEWTKDLDFESYRQDWLRSATTAPSDALLPSVAQTRKRQATGVKPPV